MFAIGKLPDLPHVKTENGIAKGLDMTTSVIQSSVLKGLFDEAISEHISAVDILARMDNEIVALCNEVISVFAKGGKLLICGNGGSAADAQHLATELTVRFERERKPLPAIALTTDTSALTATVNDYSAKHMFSRQVEAIGTHNDLLVGITTSGNSENVNWALQTAKARGMRTIALTGRDGGAAGKISDICVNVPVTKTSRIQEMHLLVYHILCRAVDQAFG